MSDSDLRNLERIYQTNPSLANARRLYTYMFRMGRTDEASALRDSLGYVDMAKALPTPTKEQCKAFAEHVARSHSWYKHLHPTQPTLFYVYLDPGACKFKDGTEVLKKDCWHYSNKPTKKYIEEFGHWVYHQAPSEETTLMTWVDPSAELPKELYFSAPCTANFYGAQFTKAVAPPRGDPNRSMLLETGSKAMHGFGVMDSIGRSVGDDSDYNIRARQSLAKGKQELRAMYRAMKEFLIKLDELFEQD